MPIILKNNVDSTLAQAISASETAAIVTAGDGAKFPALGAGDYFYATLVSAQGTREIVKVTSKSIDTLAITRAQEGTTANGFAVGSRVEMRVTAASITDLVDEHDQASEITIADAGGYYTSGTAEGALQEVGGTLRARAARDTVTALLADTVFTYTAGQLGTVAAGSIIQTRTEGFSYVVAASGVTNQHVTTAGGVKLYVVQGEQGFNVKAFGATGNGVADDSDAVEAAISAAYLAAPLLNGMRRGAAVKFPNGRYRIAQSGKLFSSLPSVTGGAGSFNLSGNGPSDSYASDGGASVLAFDPPTSAATEYMINNNDKIAWCRFQNLGFVSDNGGTFWNGPTGLGIQSFEFRDCVFKDFVDIFNIGGGSNNSEWSFFGCKFSGFTGRGFYLNNVQAVNWRFFGCDAEVFSGVLFDFEQGANVAWETGSIIPTSNTARIIRIPNTASGFGINNEPQMKFSSVRFEMRDGAWMFEKISPITNPTFVFEDCGMGGFNIPTSPSLPKVLYWRGAGLVSFIRCMNMQKYRWDYSTDGTSGESISQLNVVMLGCSLDSGYLSGSSFVLSASPQNGARYPVFNIERSGTQFNGVYRPQGSSTVNVLAQPRAVSFTVESGRIALVAVGAGWPNVQTLTLPPAYLSRLSHHPASTPAFGASTATITLKDATGGTLWTRTYTMNDGALTAQEVLLSHKIDPASTFVTFELSSSYTGAAAVPFVGALFLTY